MAVLLEYHGFCYKALVKSGIRHDGIDLLPPSCLHCLCALCNYSFS